MDPQAKIHVPESARKDKQHQHKWRTYDDGSGAFCISIDCRESIDNDEVERRLNVVEAMRYVKSGIYIGNQLRELAEGV